MASELRREVHALCPVGPVCASCIPSQGWSFALLGLDPQDVIFRSGLPVLHTRSPRRGPTPLSWPGEFMQPSDNGPV